MATCRGDAARWGLPENSPVSEVSSRPFVGTSVVRVPRGTTTLGVDMPWVERHRRRLPGSWFRTTSVQAHRRRAPGTNTIIAIVIAFAVILLLIALF